MAEMIPAFVTVLIVIFIGGYLWQDVKRGRR